MKRIGTTFSWEITSLLLGMGFKTIMKKNGREICWVDIIYLTRYFFTNYQCVTKTSELIPQSFPHNHLTSKANAQKKGGCWILRPHWKADDFNQESLLFQTSIAQMQLFSKRPIWSHHTSQNASHPLRLRLFWRQWPAIKHNKTRRNKQIKMCVFVQWYCSKDGNWRGN